MALRLYQYRFPVSPLSHVFNGTQVTTVVLQRGDYF